MAFPCFSVGSQGKMLTVHRTPLADSFPHEPHPVQEKPREEERGEMGTITRT